MYLKKYHSPIGDLYMRSDGSVITGLWFINVQDEQHDSIETTKISIPIFEKMTQWLDLYFSGKEPDFMPDYRVEDSTFFRNQVIAIVKQIKYGEVLTYQQIADQIAKENGIAKMSAQAVGRALGWNPICLLIPCHRVVGTNGSLVGYSGGIEHKIELLKLEGHDMSRFHVPRKN